MPKTEHTAAELREALLKVAGLVDKHTPGPETQMAKDLRRLASVPTKEERLIDQYGGAQKAHTNRPSFRTLNKVRKAQSNIAKYYARKLAEAQPEVLVPAKGPVTHPKFTIHQTEYGGWTAKPADQPKEES